MKKLLIICSLLLYLNAKEFKHESTFGFLSNGTLLQNFNEGRIAFSMWIEEVASLYDSKLEVKYFSDKDEIYDEFKNKKSLDMIVIPVTYYFEHKNEIDLIADNFWSVSINDKKYTRYILIGRKNLKAKGFKDLQNRTIIFDDENDIPKIWLDKKSIIYNKKRYMDVVKEEFHEKKEPTILLRVFFGKSDFGIISENTWTTMLELNPAIQNNIEIIEASKKEHFPFIGFFRKDNNNKEKVEIFFKISKNLRNFPRSEQIMNLLKFDSVFEIEKDSLKNLEKFYNEYYELKKSIKDVNTF
ncbi:hypothetical protein OZZ08_12705 [Malaciobacter mytili]|uniref:PhnD/SsuA/transferrin family substrate-binding protein n=1 Tax=Malaciobacter mytili TaxID=603050 RepID=UPI003BAF1136